MKKGIKLLNCSEIQSIIRNYFEIYSKKLKNLEDIGQFLDIHDFLKLNQENIENLKNKYSVVKLKQ